MGTNLLLDMEGVVDANKTNGGAPPMKSPFQWCNNIVLLALREGHWGSKLQVYDVYFCVVQFLIFLIRT